MQQSAMPCVLIVPEIAAPGIQSESKPSEDQMKSTVCPNMGVTTVEFDKETHAMPVKTQISYKEGRANVCHDAFPLALGCAVKRARQLNRELTVEVQDDVIIWTTYVPDCYGT